MPSTGSELTSRSLFTPPTRPLIAPDASSRASRSTAGARTASSSTRVRIVPRFPATRDRARAATFRGWEGRPARRDRFRDVAFSGRGVAACGRSRDRPGRGARARKPGVCGHGRHPRHGGFSDYRIDADFTADRVSIERSNGKRPRGDFYLVQATNYRGLLLVDGQAGCIRSRRSSTPARRTLGNAALRDALERTHRPRTTHGPRVIGATSRRTSAPRSSCRRCASAARAAQPARHVRRHARLPYLGPHRRAGRADRHGPDRAHATLRRRLSRSEVQLMPFATAGGIRGRPAGRIRT